MKYLLSLVSVLVLSFVANACPFGVQVSAPAYAFAPVVYVQPSIVYAAPVQLQAVQYVAPACSSATLLPAYQGLSYSQQSFGVDTSSYGATGFNTGYSNSFFSSRASYSGVGLSNYGNYGLVGNTFIGSNRGFFFNATGGIGNTNVFIGRGGFFNRRFVGVNTGVGALGGNVNVVVGGGGLFGRGIFGGRR